jgi:2-methylcitrate dehydratase PrpD
VTTTAALAEFMVDLEPGEVADDVRHEAKRAILDWLGVALAGSQDASARPLLALVGEWGGDGRATVIGHRTATTPPYAALANGFFGHVLDFDDTYQPARTTVHATGPAWASIMALGAAVRISGARALTAFIAGFETECRVGLAAGPAHYERGWHVTGTVGHLGAAAAASKVLGFGVDDTVTTYGTAGTQAAGLKEVYGSSGKPLHPGKAAMDGVLAAQLTRSGFTSSDTILEGPRGFLAVLSDDPDAGWLTRGLGTDWALRSNSYKPFACGSLTHPTIEAVLHLRATHGLTSDDVERVEATVHSYVSWVTAKEAPATGLQGKFSIFHAVAAAMVDGRALPGQFTDERVNAADVVAMRRRVHINVDDALPKEGARVTLHLRDGRRLIHEVPRNKGSADNPLSDGELEAKYLELAAPVLGQQAARTLAKACWALDELDDAAALFARCGAA